jgi:O-antigen/teichoic acid export membrane protein
MDKALAMGKTSATGSFRLLIGVVTSTIIMAAGTVILTRLLSPAEYGLYAIALLPSLTMTLFRDWGINSAMTKYIASYRVSHKDEETRDVMVAGLIFEVTTGIVLSLLTLFLASFIASTVFHRPESASFIAIASVSIISGSLLTASQSSFVGFERMGLNSFTIICQAIAKTVAGPILVLLGYSVLGAVLGYTLSFTAAGIIGLATFYFILFRPLRKLGTKSSNVTKTLRTMLTYGVPLSISSILGGILGQLFGFIMVSFTDDAMIGNYHAAVNFSVLLAFFTIPISTVLFPAFAKLDPQKDHELVKTVFASSVKYTAMLLVPATAAVMALSGPMINTLFGERYVYAPLFLTAYVIGNMFAMLGSLSSGSLLSGLGETKMLMKQSMLTLSIGLPLGFLLIPTLGIPGLITANIIAGLPSMFWGLHWIWKHHKAKADFQCSAKILAASAIAAATAYLSVSLFNTPNWIKLTIGVIVFLAVYIPGAPLIGALTQADIENLRTMLSGLGAVSKMANIPLKLAEKATHIRHSGKNNHD